VPSNALLLTLIAPIGLSLLNLGSPIALNAIVSLVIINLVVSYLLVASTSLYSRCTRTTAWPDHMTYGLGYRTGIAVDIFTIGFLATGSVIVMSVLRDHPSRNHADNPTQVSPRDPSHGGTDELGCRLVRRGLRDRCFILLLPWSKALRTSARFYVAVALSRHLSSCARSRWWKMDEEG